MTLKPFHVKPYLNIHSLYIQGYRSYRDPITFNMDTQGIFLVKGLNGSGKTSLFASLAFGLYGVDLYGVKNEDLISWGYLGTRVIVSLSCLAGRFSVCRQINYKAKKTDDYNDLPKSGLGIYNQDGENISCKTKADTQKQIIDIIGVEWDVFKHSIYYPQRSNSFITAEPWLQKKYLENIFDIGYLTEAKDHAKEKTQQLEISLTSTQAEIVKIESDIDQRNEFIKEMDSRSAQQALDNKHKLQTLEKEMQGWGVSLKINKEKHAQASTAREQKEAEEARLSKQTNDAVQALAMKIEHVERALVNKQQEKDQYKRTVSDSDRSAAAHREELEKFKGVCSLCENELTEAQKDAYISRIDGRVKEATAEVAKHRRLAHEAEPPILSLISEKESLQAQVRIRIDDGHRAEIALQQERKILSLQENEAFGKMKEAGSAKEQIERQIESIKQASKEYDTTQYKRQVLDLKQSLIKKQQDLDRVKEVEFAYRWWAQTGFSGKGLLGYIVGSAMQQLNNFINRYALQMDMSVHFKVDTSLQSLPIKINCFKEGREIGFSELSGGERNRMEICTNLGMHDFFTDQFSCNIVVMDEPFEGLDVEGLADVANLLRSKNIEGKALYIITHENRIDNAEFRAIRIIKKEGQSEVHVEN